MEATISIASAPDNFWGNSARPNSKNPALIRPGEDFSIPPGSTICKTRRRQTEIGLAPLPFLGSAIGASRPQLGEAEHLDDFRQSLCLLLQTFSRGGRLLDERGVLLRHLVKLRDGTVDLADA